MNLGEKILKERKKKGLSQEELGELVNVTRQTISNWELGATLPNPEQLKKLSQALEMSIDKLLENDVANILEEKIIATENITRKQGKILKIILVTLRKRI